MQADSGLVRLWAERTYGLIVLHPTGIRFSNQTGGHACRQSEEEGVFVPIDLDWPVIEAHFSGPPWQGWCSDRLDEATADFLDSRFQADAEVFASTLKLRVDRERLHESMEAWVYVRFEEEKSDFPLVAGFGTQGVLTWPNSD